MDRLDPSLEASDALKTAAPSLLGFSDIIPMLAPWMTHKGTLVNVLPAPIKEPWGIMHHPTSRVTFQRKLEEARFTAESCISVKTKILEARNKILKRTPRCHGYIMGSRSGLLAVQDLDALQEAYGMTTEYFQQNYLHLFELVKVHLVRVANIEERIRKYFLRPDAGERVEESTYSAAIELYWNDIPTYQKLMHEKYHGVKDGDAEAAWIMLIFRAMLWSLAHNFDDHQAPLPARYYGSSVPIYIG